MICWDQFTCSVWVDKLTRIMETENPSLQTTIFAKDHPTPSNDVRQMLMFLFSTPFSLTVAVCRWKICDGHSDGWVVVRQRCEPIFTGFEDCEWMSHLITGLDKTIIALSVLITLVSSPTGSSFLLLVRFQIYNYTQSACSRLITPRSLQEAAKSRHTLND